MGSAIRQAMQGVGRHVSGLARGHARAAPGAVPAGAPAQRAAVPRFCAGRAEHADDRGRRPRNRSDILESSPHAVCSYGLRRVYYSAFSPIPDASRDLRRRRPALMREHRLYQADWLMRFYGYGAGEIAAASRHGMLDLEIDPKLAWATGQPTAVPRGPQPCAAQPAAARAGPGHADGGTACWRRAAVRRLRLDDLLRLRAPVQKALPFVLIDGHRPLLARPTRPRCALPADRAVAGQPGPGTAQRHARAKRAAGHRS